MKHSNMKSMPLGVISVALAASLFVDAAAYAAEGVRERRNTRETTTQSAPAPAPAPAAAPTSPTVCTVTEVLPAPTPVVTEAAPPPETATDGRQRRGSRTSPATSTPASSAPIVITKIVPCDSGAPTAAAPAVADPQGPTVSAPETQRPGLLTDQSTLLSTPKPESILPAGESLAVNAIPEPSMIALFAAGAVGIALARRRRRS